MKKMFYFNNQKGKIKIKQKYFFLFFELIIVLLKITLIESVTLKNTRKLNNNYSVIKLVIQVPEGIYSRNYNIKILNDQFSPLPSQVLVNGEIRNDCNKTCELTNGKYNITLRFENQINSCYEMFYNLNNIIEVDLSDFDASKVNDMFSMFADCKNLEKINFGNINTSSVENMQSLFYGCENLISIDLSNLNTSNVKTMRTMFCGCSSLKKINFGNINTSSVESMQALFESCSNLISIDLSNFDTSKVETMEKMFFKCSKLKYLDLSNFNTQKITTIFAMFYYCQSLIFLNLKNFQISTKVDRTNAFYEISKNVKYCIQDENTKTNLIGYKQSICDDDCFKKNIKIDINNNKCIASCLGQIYYGSTYYKYEYNNICYDECPTGAYPFFCNGNECNNNISECFDEIPENYYLDIYKKVYKKCFETCKYCYGDGDETNNNCKECITDYTFLNENNFETNCFIRCDYYYYFDENNKYNCTHEFLCPEEYNKLVSNKNKCINYCKKDDTYQYEYNNICYKECPNNTYLLEDNNDNLCYNHSIDGYYLDTRSQKYKKCYETCKKCDVGGNKTNNNCLECKSNLSLYKNIMNISNCYPTCENNYYFDESNNFHCNETFPKEYNETLIEKNKCNNDSKNDDAYKYLYNNTCYKKCPNDTYILEDDNFTCYDKTPEHYYLDLDNKIFKKCYNTCATCDKGGNGTNHNCQECKNGYDKYENPMNISNCYPKCEYYYYFDSSNNFSCTSDYKCPNDFPKLIKEKKQCVKIQNIENTAVLDDISTSIKEVKDESIENTVTFDGISTSIKEVIDERDKRIDTFRENLANFNISKNEDIMETKDNVQYQITTTDNQKNNINKNVSTIDLGTCEEKLKNIYGIDKSLPLIIFKIDYFSPDTLIPIIGYEIYHPLNKSKLDLKYCEDILIKLNIPVIIDEENLFKYDPNSEYYNDNCFSYTTENGTDIILNDRKQEFTDNNLSLCEYNCNYTGYNQEDKQSSCNCVIKNKMDLISEIIENPNKLSNNFATEETDTSSGSSNIISITCTKALFSKEGLKKNISSYILLIFIAQFLLSIILFMKCGYPLLVNDINEIINEKEKIQKQNPIKNQMILPQNKGRRKRKKKKSRSKRKVNYPPKKYSLNFFNNNLNLSKVNNNANKKNKNNLDTESINSNNNNNKNNNESTMQKIINKIKIVYTDYELNTFEYKYAILHDKRSCGEYYCSVIKEKNLILFSFCPRKDYNSIIIRSSIFSLSFSIYYAVNFAFFTDKIMHQIYEDGGKYDVLYFLPKIGISFVISYYLTAIIKLIFLSERNIAKVRQQPSLSLAYHYSEKARKNLVIKYILYFIFGLGFLVFFWMLLSSFGAVYPNTQMFIFKNALISFAMALVYPFFIYIFPCALRMFSLNSGNKDNECVYNISKFLQML